jgi:hypothetical protein
MAIAVLFDFDVPIERYDQALQQAPELLTQPARRSHVCYRTPSGWGVVDMWDSVEDFNTFGEVLRPVLESVGIPPNEPRIYEVHNTI